MLQTFKKQYKQYEVSAQADQNHIQKAERDELPLNSFEMHLERFGQFKSMRIIHYHQLWMD